MYEPDKFINDYVSWALVSLFLLERESLLFSHTILFESDFIGDQASPLQRFLYVECKLLIESEN